MYIGFNGLQKSCDCTTSTFVIFLRFLLTVVAQTYEVEADNEYVIRGNAAVMKCEIPSFVSDFVTVEGWSDSQGSNYLPGDNDYGSTANI